MCHKDVTVGKRKWQGKWLAKMARNYKEYYTVDLSCDDWVRTQKPVEKLKVHKCIFLEGRPDVPMRYSIFLLWPKIKGEI